MIRTPRALIVGALLAVGVLLAGCGGNSDPLATQPQGPSAAGTVRVGSANFTENRLLAEIYATGLQIRGVPVERRFGIGSRETYFPALQNGEIDLVPDYTGNLLQFLDSGRDRHRVAGRLPADRGEAPAVATMLQPSAAEDKDAVVVTRAFATQNNLRSIADLTRQCPTIAFGGPPEFQQRPYGTAGLSRLYGCNFREFRALDAGGPLTVAALRDGTVQAADLFTTDSSIPENDFVVLDDPRSNFAAQNVVPVINRAKTTDPRVAEVLDQISAKLDTTVLTDLNRRLAGPDRPTPPPSPATGSPPPASAEPRADTATRARARWTTRSGRRRAPRQGTPRALISPGVRARLLVVGVVAGEEGRQPVDGAGVLGGGVEERTHPVGQPGQADLLVAAPLLELLDAAVGEVHRPPYSARASAMSAFCSTSCTFATPAAGAAMRRRETRRRFGRRPFIRSFSHRPEERPGALVRRLLLDPDGVRGVRVAVEHRRQLLGRDRVELLHPHDGDVVGAPRLLPGGDQLVVDLAGAEQQPRHAVGRALGERGVVEDRPVAAGGEVLDRADRGLVAQHRLRREDDQRAAHAVERVTAQQVEVVRRARRARRRSSTPRRTASGSARCAPRCGRGPGPRGRGGAGGRRRRSGPTWPHRTR